ncbi:MAG TPA: hypothetical protein VEH07_08855 [Alphaproteobacteria bacterium]|nr:hypothetical protein [Alphaproteobacteria bacterium]
MQDSRLGKLGRMSAVLAISAWLITVNAPSSAQGVITLDHAVRNCRLISNEKQRLSCYDHVIDEADASLAQQAAPAPIASAAPQVAQAAPAALPKPSEAAASEPQLVPRAPAANPAPSAPPRETPDAPQPKKSATARSSNGEAVIASAKWSRGSIEITTQDGAVWQQIDTTNLQTLPKAGDHLSVSGGIFGKHICQYGASALFDCRQK